MKEPIKLEQLTVWGLVPPQPPLYFRDAKFILELHRCSRLSAPGATLQEQYLKPRVCFQQQELFGEEEAEFNGVMKRRKREKHRLLLQNFEGKRTNCRNIKGREWKWDQTFSWLSFGSFSDSFLTTWKIKPAFYNFNNQRPPTASPVNILSKCFLQLGVEGLSSLCSWNQELVLSSSSSTSFISFKTFLFFLHLLHSLSAPPLRHLLPSRPHLPVQLPVSLTRQNKANQTDCLQEKIK